MPTEGVEPDGGLRAGRCSLVGGTSASQGDTLRLAECKTVHVQTRRSRLSCAAEYNDWVVGPGVLHQFRLDGGGGRPLQRGGRGGVAA